MPLKINFSTISFELFKSLPAIFHTRQVSEPELASGHLENPRTSPEAKTVLRVLVFFLLFLGLPISSKLVDAGTLNERVDDIHQATSNGACDDQEADFYAEPREINPEWWENYEMPRSADEVLPPEQQTLKNELGVFYDKDYYTELAERLLGMDRIVVDDETYLDAMLVIAAYQHRFQGKEIELSGFVYRDAAMSVDELALTRKTTTCCISHATLYGILVRGEGLDVFEDESWVLIRGIIDEDIIFEQNMLMITVLDAEKISPPDQTYVYPYLYWQHQP